MTEQRTCTWTFDDWEFCTWATECGELFAFTDGGPEDNNFRYCHGCGGKLVIVRPEPEAEEEDAA